ncbi:hypothetical protein D3C80_1684510 [compost metagenome]
MVHLVQFNMVGLQPLQGSFQMAADNVGGEAALIIGSVKRITHGTIDFCRQHNLFPPSPAKLEPAADYRLCEPGVFTPSVNVSGIKKINPGIQRGVHNAESFLLIGNGAEIHRAQTEAANLKP